MVRYNFEHHLSLNSWISEISMSCSGRICSSGVSIFISIYNQIMVISRAFTDNHGYFFEYFWITALEKKPHPTLELVLRVFLAFRLVPWALCLSHRHQSYRKNNHGESRHWERLKLCHKSLDLIHYKVYTDIYLII